MDDFTIPLVDPNVVHAGWSVRVEHCQPHQYQYLLIEHLPHANRVYTSGHLFFPEPFIALVFALQEMKVRRRIQLQI